MSIVARIANQAMFLLFILLNLKALHYQTHLTNDIDFWPCLYYIFQQNLEIVFVILFLKASECPQTRLPRFLDHVGAYV